MFAKQLLWRELTFTTATLLFGYVTQLVEYRPFKARVVGSNPTIPIIMRNGNKNKMKGDFVWLVDYLLKPID